MLKQSKTAVSESKGVARVMDMLQSRGEEEGAQMDLKPGLGNEDTIVLDTTAEFCKQVGEEEENGECGGR